MDADQQARTQAQALFARNLELISEGRITEWVELFDPEGVLEFPYPLPGIPARFTGHRELYEHMKDFPKQFDVRFSGLTFHETTDPELVVAEFVGDGRVSSPVDRSTRSTSRWSGSGTGGSSTSGTSGTPWRPSGPG